MNATDPIPSVRLDKWLWAARFFKTRALAAEAIRGGKVRIGGTRAKVSRMIRMGEQLHIRRGRYEYVVIVQALSDRRGPAPEATRLYAETEQSIRDRETLASQLRLQAAAIEYPRAKPGKQNRRRLIRINRGQQ